eukprot:scaffold177509_cov23-Tisochrysis_lutea.AAC.1
MDSSPSIADSQTPGAKPVIVKRSCTEAMLKVCLLRPSCGPSCTDTLQAVCLCVTCFFTLHHHYALVHGGHAEDYFSLPSTFHERKEARLECNKR